MQAPPTTPVVPPQNLEAEESVLGAMLLSETAIGSVTEILDASDFYRGSHATVYLACLELWKKGEPVDAITLVNELEEQGALETVGGSARIAELAALVPATANAGESQFAAGGGWFAVSVWASCASCTSWRRTLRM